MIVLPALLGAQGRGGRGGRGGVAGNGAPDTTRGFPINDRNITLYCTRCHSRDSTGIVQRLSFERKTPEGWETSVRRMYMLNGVKLDPDIARAVVRYLSNAQGLAPAEAKPARFDAERRMIEFRYAADSSTERTCRACHTMGRVMAQRRSREEWELLLATHRGLYPDVDFQGFRRGGPPGPGQPAQPEPMDQALTHLARAFPLRTQEWAAWSGSMRPARLEGTWLLTGNEPGKGPFYGKMTVTKTPAAEDEFTTKATYRYARDAKARATTRSGKSIIYTGFQWRGKSSSTPADTMREVMFVEQGWQEMSGRWFRGAYDEIGMDVQLTRVNANPVVAGLSEKALKSPSAEQDFTVFGANFPKDVKAADVDLGPGIKVARMVRASADSITVRVTVDSGAAQGPRDLFIAGASVRNGLSIYDKISRIKVSPQAGLARAGGANFPKQLQQFEVTAWSNGPDGKPDTPDDIEIGLIDPVWSLEEYGVTYDDDDLQFVGKIDQTGLFTPNVDGPNPQRTGSRNNIGDVWVVATWTPPGAGARPMKARAHLVVTVPLYMRWLQGEPTPARRVTP